MNNFEKEPLKEKKPETFGEISDKESLEGESESLKKFFELVSSRVKGGENIEDIIKENREFLEKLNFLNEKGMAMRDKILNKVDGRVRAEDSKKEEVNKNMNFEKENTAEKQDKSFNNDDYDPIGEIAEGYVLNQKKKSEDFKREKKEEEIKKAYEIAKEYWDQKDKEKSAEQKSKDGSKENTQEKIKEELLAEKNKELEKELEERLKGALTSNGIRSEEKAHDIKRNFYLEKLDYSVKYVGILWWRKGRILDKDGKFVLDEKNKKPVEFKPTFKHKGEMPIIKFLKEELEKKNKIDKEKKSDGKEAVVSEPEKKSPEETKESKIDKEKSGEEKRDGAEKKSNEKKPENKESEKVFNIVKFFSDCVSGRGFFSKENLKKITVEKNAKEITEALKSYGREVKWPDDFEGKIKKYDQEKSESLRFDKVKEKKGLNFFGLNFFGWFADLIFRMNIPVLFWNIPLMKYFRKNKK